MIVLLIRDGLGNQMFQYAFARSLQLETKQKLFCSLQCFDGDKENRKYALNNFNIAKIKILPEKTDIFTGLLYKIFNKIRCIKKVENTEIYMDRNIINAECSDVYGWLDYPNVKFGKVVLVRGYFQNHQNFQKYAGPICQELKVKTEPSVENQKMLENIAKSNSVCVHIRRGDYLNPEWSYLNICNYNYYKKAMELVKEKVENPVFYIFSNTSEDIAWIKENYDFSEYNVEYVDLNNPDYEELRLMYSCKHFVISNSTFSWWAQYLGEYENKVVVAPSEWNREVEDCSGIYMSDWEIVEV